MSECYAVACFSIYSVQPKRGLHMVVPSGGVVGRVEWSIGPAHCFRYTCDALPPALEACVGVSVELEWPAPSNLRAHRTVKGYVSADTLS